MASNARSVGHARARLHDDLGHPDPRIDRVRSNADVHTTGALGEAAFSARYGYPVDTSDRPGGDHGIDFWTALGSVDVKTNHRLFPTNYLLITPGKPIAAHLYVLAAKISETEARLLGWAFRHTVNLAEIDAEGERFAPGARYLPHTALRPMEELDRLLHTWIGVQRDRPEDFARRWQDWYPDDPLPPLPADALGP